MSELGGINAVCETEAVIALGYAYVLAKQLKIPFGKNK